MKGSFSRERARESNCRRIRTPCPVAHVFANRACRTPGHPHDRMTTSTWPRYSRARIAVLSRVSLERSERFHRKVMLESVFRSSARAVLALMIALTPLPVITTPPASAGLGPCALMPALYPLLISSRRSTQARSCRASTSNDELVEREAHRFAPRRLLLCSCARPPRPRLTAPRKSSAFACSLRNRDRDLDLDRADRRVTIMISRQCVRERETSLVPVC